MERFAKIKSAGKRRKLNLNLLCRCCGLENEDATLIIDAICADEDESSFQEKVLCLTGINVQSSDKMPQKMCSMCMDKINDFFEFRLMAQNTEKQTREALGLLAAPKIPVPKFIPNTTPMVSLVDLKYSAENSLLIERALARAGKKIEDIPSTSKKRTNIVPPAPQPPAKKSKKGVSCRICVGSHFAYQSDLNDHLLKEHTANIAKYACGSCRETFEQLSDHKAHESQHSRDKLPFHCWICSSNFAKQRDFNKHTMNYNCHQKEKLEASVEDIKCFQCKKKFLTQNLFEWHGCFLKTRGSCSKCGQYYQKKKMLFKHYVMCEGRFEAPEAARDPARSLIKDEESNIRAPVKVSNTKGPKKKIVPARKMSAHSSIVKTELQLETNVDPMDDEEYANYEEDITYDNFGNDSDSDDARSALEPVVQLQEQKKSSTSPGVRVKQERISDRPVVQQKQMLPSAQLIRNIKKEKGANSAMVMATVVTSAKPISQQNISLLKLRIKAEKSDNQSAVTQVLNPFSVGKRNLSSADRKKLYKIPHGLAMKIKLEKKDAGYGDNMEERDEAEPEDEDLLIDAPASPVVNIKQEKIDPGYDSRDVTKSKLINPMALLREKSSLTNGSSEKSLVISAVTSINPASPGPVNDADSTMTQNDAEPRETTEINDAREPRDKSTMMVQIPSEFYENQENHSSQLADCDELFQAKAPETASIDEKHEEIQQIDTNDDLDALLKSYDEEPPPTDFNTDNLFQELLKFD